MKKFIRCLILCLTVGCLLLSGCNAQPEQKKYNATYLNLFDTVTTVVGFAQSEDYASHLHCAGLNVVRARRLRWLVPIHLA